MDIVTRRQGWILCTEGRGGYCEAHSDRCRGETYYFKVQGGDSDSLGKQNYHPFYITSDPNGGYGNKIESERGEPWVFLTYQYLRQTCTMNRTKIPQNEQIPIMITFVHKKGKDQNRLYFCRLVTVNN